MKAFIEDYRTVIKLRRDQPKISCQHIYLWSYIERQETGHGRPISKANEIKKEKVNG